MQIKVGYFTKKIYNSHLELWLGVKDKMPTNHDIKWKDYTISVINQGLIRRFFSILPYFPSESIDFDVKLTRHKKTFDKQLSYRWQLINSVDKTVVENHGGKGEITVPRFNPFVLKKQGISLGRIAEKGRYKVQLMVGNGVEASPYADILEFTVKADEIENRIVWIAGGAGIIASVVALALLVMM